MKLIQRIKQAFRKREPEPDPVIDALILALDKPSDWYLGGGILVQLRGSFGVSVNCGRVWADKWTQYPSGHPHAKRVIEAAKRCAAAKISAPADPARGEGGKP